MAESLVGLGEDSEDGEFTGEIGVMEKGGRLQFVRATGNDIKSRSPTPTSSENETETVATNIEMGRQKKSSRKYRSKTGGKQKGRHSDRKNDTNRGRSSNIQQQAGINYLDPVQITSGGNSQPGGSVSGSQSGSDLLACRKDSGVLSVASQAEFEDSLDQLSLDNGGIESEEQNCKEVSLNNEVNEEKFPGARQRDQDQGKMEDDSSKYIPPIIGGQQKETRNDSPETVTRNTSFNMSAMSEDPEAKQKLKDAIFKNWLEGKNQELRRKHKESMKSTISEKEQEEKRRRSEIAYKSWLERKSMNKREKERNQKLHFDEAFKDTRVRSAEISFDAWLQKKINQRRQEAMLAERARQEQEEVAKHVNPALSKLAYNKYVLN